MMEEHTRIVFTMLGRERLWNWTEVATGKGTEKQMRGDYNSLQCAGY